MASSVVFIALLLGHWSHVANIVTSDENLAKCLILGMTFAVSSLLHILVKRDPLQDRVQVSIHADQHTQVHTPVI